MPSNHDQPRNVHHRFLLSIPRVKVGWQMLPVEHLDAGAEKPTDLRHAASIPPISGTSLPASGL